MSSKDNPTAPDDGMNIPGQGKSKARDDLKRRGQGPLDDFGGAAAAAEASGETR